MASLHTLIYGGKCVKIEWRGNIFDYQGWLSCEILLFCIYMYSSFILQFMLMIVSQDCLLELCRVPVENAFHFVSRQSFSLQFQGIFADAMLVFSNVCQIISCQAG